jgi:hypothetical protein
MVWRNDPLHTDNGFGSEAKTQSSVDGGSVERIGCGVEIRKETGVS